MMGFEQEKIDEQLNNMLRDIVIPSGLKSQLKKIPFQNVPAQPQSSDAEPIPIVVVSPSTDRSRTPLFTLVLAASLVGIGLFVASQYLPDSDDGGNAIEKIADNQQPNDNVDKGLPESPVPADLKNGLAEFLSMVEQLESEIHAIEVAQMNAQLASLQQTATVQFNQREVESMIAAMTEEYSIPLGMPDTKVNSGMVQVIEQFPGTRGAEIAQRYLNQASN